MAESGGEEEASLNLTGFLFGNINEKGELEDTEVLDEVRVNSLVGNICCNVIMHVFFLPC